MKEKILTLVAILVATSAVTSFAANQCPTAKNWDNNKSSSTCGSDGYCPNESKGGDCSGPNNTTTNCFKAQNPSYYDQQLWRVTDGGTNCADGCTSNGTSYNQAYYPTTDAPPCTAG